MDAEFAAAADAILNKATSGELGVPGVVALASDRAGEFYARAVGVRRLGQAAPMTTDSVLALFSCSKAVTGTAVLQLVEQGLLDLDAPAKRYAPDIGALEVLEGFDEHGAMRLRPPRRDITTRMLMTHTAGFGYPYFSATLKRLAAERGQPDPRLGTKQGLMPPLLFDPGEQWEYGISIDWCGQVVEAIVGERLDAILKAHVFEPLGMTMSGFALTPAMRARRASMHQRDRDGALRAIDFELPDNPEVFMGGGALFASAEDYMRFLRMWLNDGAGERDRVLRRRDSRPGRARPPGRDEDRMHAQRQPFDDARPRILSRPAEVMGPDLHGQRRGCADWPARRLDRLGGPGQSLLLGRPQQRRRRLLGDAALPIHGPGRAQRVPGLRERGLRRLAPRLMSAENWPRFSRRGRGASCSRKSFFEILPTGVFGSSSRISSAPIISCLPSRSFRNAFNSSSVSGGAPAFSLTKAFGCLAAIGVGNADDADLLDRRMLVDRLLDVARIDVEAAARAACPWCGRRCRRSRPRPCSRRRRCGRSRPPSSALAVASGFFQ